MRRAVMGVVLMSAAAGGACDRGTGLEPSATIRSLTVNPTQGRPGTVATVTWVAGELTYSVRLKQGRCGAPPVYEYSCPGMVTLADDLPPRGSRTLALNETSHVCVFPARNGGVFDPQGLCVQTTVVP